MPNLLLDEFYKARQSQQDVAAEEQQAVLRDLSIQSQRQQMEPGSTEQLERQARGAKASSYLENIASITEQEKQGRELENLETRNTLIAKRIYGGENGQAVIDEQTDLPPGIKFNWIPMGDEKIAGFIMPGEDTPQPIWGKDRETLLAHNLQIKLAKAKEKEKPIKNNTVPTTAEIKNVKSLAAGDEDLADIRDLPVEKGKEHPMDSFATLVANGAKKDIVDDPTLSWEEAVQKNYESAKKEHITEAKETGYLDLELDQPATFSLKPKTAVNKAREERRQQKDGKIAIFDKATKKFLRYE